MNSKRNDVRPGESSSGLPRSVVSWFSETQGLGDAPATPPEACASCGAGEGIQWLRMVTDWEDYMCDKHDVPTPEGVCLVPLCSRCRAWAELIEIAEMAIPHLADSQCVRIRQERNRFLESLTVDLVRGIRVSEELTSFSE